MRPPTSHPNLLVADNYLKLTTIHTKMGRDDKVIGDKGIGEYYLSESLKTVKSEWAFQIQKKFGFILNRK